MNLSSNILALFMSLITPLNMPGQGNDASQKAAQAVLETHDLKAELDMYSKNIEKLAWDYSPVTKQQAAYIAAPYVVIAPIYNRHLNTSQFGELKVKTPIFGLDLSPQIDYNWNNQDTISSMLVLKRNF